MKAAWRLLPILLLCAADAVNGESAATGLFNEANAHYRRGEYEAARDKYQQIAGMGIRNASLYYNLGNASFKLDSLGDAILWYERALLLEPRDPDIAANLQFANLVKKDRDESAENIVVAGLIRAYRMPSLNELSVVLFLSIAGVAALAIWRLWARDRANTLWIAGMAAASTALLVSALFLGARAIEAEEANEAILTVSSEVARSAPDADETVVFVVHEGTKVVVQREEKAWVLVRLRNGWGGWLPRASITVI